MTGSDGESRRRAANIFDVARLAGVSHQTVSRVINGHPSVRPATRERVQEAVVQLRYRPSTAARALVTRRTRNIGLITSGTPDYGPSSTVLAFTTAARVARYTVSISSLADTGLESMRISVEALLGQAVEAVVLIPDRRPALDAIAALALEVPLIVVDASPQSSFRSVSIDQYGGAAAATRHLIELGHRKILHLGGPTDSMEAAERDRGWREAMSEAGLVTERPWVGDWSPDSGYRFGVEIAQRSDVTAVFSANDQMALGLIHGLSTAGVRVPDDVSLIGFDDIPEAAHFAPPLSTLRQDFAGLGADIMTAVLDVLTDNETEPTRRMPELVVRQSTGAPAYQRTRPASGRQSTVRR